jgi:protein ImuB
MVVWCHDWPVVAAGTRPDQPAAVLHANRVVACSPAARAEGVRIGHRRREAQGRAPDLAIFDHDDRRDARRFEAVAQAVEVFTPRIELTRPGACTFTTRGPSRYFGGDQALAEQVHDRVHDVMEGLGWPDAVRIGVADGAFAATLAARVSDDAHAAGASPITLVEPGTSSAFVAPFPVAALDRPELADVFARLGLRTLGSVAALATADVVARFGAEGLAAHRRARGLDEHPLDAREPPPDLVVSAVLDPPAERIDIAAFVAKSLADELFDNLATRGLSCTRVLIGAETEHGEAIERAWRYEGTLTAGAVTDRVRWQLEGWLQSAGGAAGRAPTDSSTGPDRTTNHPARGSGGPVPNRPTSGITLLRLTPDEVVPAHGRQLGFWGGETEADTRAGRALARVQGLLGPDAVLVPEWRGGRGPGEQLTLVPAAAVDLTEARPATRPDWVTAPWPGRIPAPAPALVHPEPLSLDVRDDREERVGVDGRGLLSAAPVAISIDDGPWRELDGWAGPWPAEERWWDPAAHRRRARFQFVVDGTAHLATLEGGRWWIEATYD